MIKDIPIADLRNHAVEILSKAYLELGQNPTEDTIVSVGLILADDLSRDFNKMEVQDIRESFRIGIRETQDFHITVKTYYKWLKAHQQVIWDNETIPEQQQDKRLNYRSRQGTGMKQINIKNIKLLK
tara:strand:- start:671 stop:1051 length:381 start_codon:yes stop_codon:yes gene_type:complete